MFSRKAYIFMLIFLSSAKSEHVEQQYEELVRVISSNIRSSLDILAHTAQEAHPKLGLSQPIDPLPAPAPLRYTNDGDLLKLRLLLSNVTLTGLSSINIQEVFFDGYPKLDGVSSNKTRSEISSTTEHTFTYEDDEPITENNSEFPKSVESQSTGENHDYNYNDRSYDYYYYDQPLNHEIDGYHPTEERGFHEYNYKDGDLERTIAHTRYERSISDARFRHMGKHPHKKRNRTPLVFHIKNHKHSTRHHHKSHKKHRRGKSIRSAPPEEKSNPVRLAATVRVALNNLHVAAQYVIRGSAGGVFTFKEQGNLELLLPNVFLTSRFNITIVTDHPGMRHWNSRKYHVRVQKIQTRMTLESPKLDLIPDSRSPEWIRRQVQEKMDELGSGVGRRDGAIRLLLRQWAKLLRRLVLKASKK